MIKKLTGSTTHADALAKMFCDVHCVMFIQWLRVIVVILLLLWIHTFAA